MSDRQHSVTFNKAESDYLQSEAAALGIRISDLIRNIVMNRRIEYANERGRYMGELAVTYGHKCVDVLGELGNALVGQKIMKCANHRRGHTLTVSDLYYMPIEMWLEIRPINERARSKIAALIDQFNQSRI